MGDTRSKSSLSLPLLTMRAAMRAMKAKKRVSKIAKGRFAKAVVFRGNKTRTTGGLQKSDIMKNSRGKLVSKKKSAVAKRLYGSTIRGWIQAVGKARKALNVKGFVAINGKSPQGKALYAKAKSFWSK